MFQKEKKCNSAYLKPVDGRRGPPIMKSCTDRKRNGGEGEVRKKRYMAWIYDLWTM